NMLQYVNHIDLRSFGLIPELIGRLPVLVHLNDLDKSAMIKILTEPKNSLIKQYRKLMEMEGIELEFTDDALDLIADTAIEFKLGARGLRSICESVLTDAMYELPGNKKIKRFVIDKEYVGSKLSESKIHKLKAA
ncbi:MAG TPA: ATP-dependent Clp protease ATP-binding subunit ClpX, partial [Saprospiraceae bacterium]|nr:ATP-dependent Clp protease ATP-binding subunit ClpX [Saprospiraceae bacterium]